MRLHFHFSLSCTGEGNGSPLQCSCLESPRDGDTWWAAVCGVAQGRTRLNRLRSSSRNSQAGEILRSTALVDHYYFPFGFSHSSDFQICLHVGITREAYRNARVASPLPSPSPHDCALGGLGCGLGIENFKDAQIQMCCQLQETRSYTF